VWSARVSARCRGELGADLAGFRRAEFGVETKSLLPVLACLARITGGVIGAGEAVVRAGLLVWVASLAGYGEGLVVLSAGLHGQARAGQGFPEAVERLGFGGPVAQFIVDGKRLPVESDSLLETSLAQ
jgi:hypothetical protein